MTGQAEQDRQSFSEQEIACPVLLQKDMAVAKAYQAKGTPTGYLTNAEGKIASELAPRMTAMSGEARGRCTSRCIG